MDPDGVVQHSDFHIKAELAIQMINKLKKAESKEQRWDSTPFVLYSLFCLR